MKTRLDTRSARTSDPQVGLKFRLVGEDGRVETLLVDADRALVGSAAHCEVRLPGSTAYEHLEVFVHAGAACFATRPLGVAAGVPWLDGEPCAEGVLSHWSKLSVGATALSVEIVTLGPPKAKPPLWAFGALAVIAVGTLTTLAAARGSVAELPAIPEAPALLSPVDGASCGRDGDVEELAALGAERLRVGLSKRERTPFAPREGVEAVAHLDAAAACFERAGKREDAATAKASAASMRAKVEQEYRIRRLRLEHAYRIHDPAAVKRELAVLVPMTAGLRGPYTDWLAALDRAASAELDQRGRL